MPIFRILLGIHSYRQPDLKDCGINLENMILKRLWGEDSQASFTQREMLKQLGIEIGFGSGMIASGEDFVSSPTD